jgi:hypothetical protein
VSPKNRTSAPADEKSGRITAHDIAAITEPTMALRK